MDIMPRMKDDKKYIHKTITIIEEQEKYIQENALNLSRFVQKSLDEAMGKKKAKR